MRRTGRNLDDPRCVGAGLQQSRVDRRREDRHRVSVLMRVAQALLEVRQGRQRFGIVDDQIEKLRDAQRRERLHQEKAQPREPLHEDSRRRRVWRRAWHEHVAQPPRHALAQPRKDTVQQTLVELLRAAAL